MVGTRTEYDTAAMRDSYVEGEDFSYLQFVGLKGDGMLSRVDLPALGRDFQVPVFIAQGAEDLVTVPEVAKRYFAGLSAPDKRFVLVPRAGHDPNQPLVDALFELIRQSVALPSGRSAARAQQENQQDSRHDRNQQ